MIKEKLDKICITVFVVSLSLPIPIIYSAISFSLCLFLLSFNFKLGAFLRIPKDTFLILCLSFFFIDFIRNSIILEFDKSQFQSIKLAFLIGPFVLLKSHKFLKENINFILISFTVGVGIYICYAWFYALYFYFLKFPEFYTFSLSDGYLRYMFYNYLPNAFHHTYIGIYIMFSVIIIYVETFNLKKIKSVFGLSLIVFLIISLFYMSSKLTFLMTVLSLFLISLKVDKRYYLFISITTITATFGLFLFLNKADRILLSLKHSVDYRMEIYSCGIKACLDNFLLGIGYDNFTLIINKYCNTFELFEHFIPHNIFLREFLSNGFFGFAVLLSLIIFLLIVSFKSRNIFFILLVVSLFIVGLIEDVLYIQRGVLFFVFFISLFYSINKKQHI